MIYHQTAVRHYFESPDLDSPDIFIQFCDNEAMANIITASVWEEPLSPIMLFSDVEYARQILEFAKEELTANGYKFIRQETLIDQDIDYPERGVDD